MPYLKDEKFWSGLQETDQTSKKAAFDGFPLLFYSVCGFLLNSWRKEGRTELEESSVWPRMWGCLESRRERRDQNGSDWDNINFWNEFRRITTYSWGKLRGQALFPPNNPLESSSNWWQLNNSWQMSWGQLLYIPFKSWFFFWFHLDPEKVILY